MNLDDEITYSINYLGKNKTLHVASNNASSHLCQATHVNNSTRHYTCMS